MLQAKEIDTICNCGHRKSQHGSWGSCYKVKMTKVRKKLNGKYVMIEEHWNCSCKKFQERKE